MSTSKKPVFQKSKSPNAVEHAFKRAVAMTSTSLASQLGGRGGLPGNIQLQVDVHVCLLDAMTDNFPITRKEIGANTVPSKPPIEADAQGWGICLADFGHKLHQLNQIYLFYVHKPRYAEETIDEKFPDIVLYLTQKILNQFQGKEQ